MAGKISTDQVKAEVKRFWETFASKSAEQLSDFYAPHASVFGSSSPRSEPGRLAATRRQREYFHDRASARANTSMLDLVLLDDHIAIATYNFEFHATQVAAAHTNTNSVKEDITNGRATQDFALEPDGRLRIVHAH